MNRASHICLVAGARPNFMKVAPIRRQLDRTPECFRTTLVHTGQHYDADMSDVFFQDLDLSRPERFLGVGSGSHAEQTARIMMEFEKACVEERPDLVMVVGDVNSTMGCAITAKKMCIPVAHVEAGLRSRDWTMPEEINRVVTDAISDLLFTPSRDADENLLHEGVDPEKIHFVGNVMIDSLLAQLPRAESREAFRRFGVEAGRYAVLTLHRPSNVDTPDVLSAIVDVMVELSRQLPIIWPAHPRSRSALEQFGLMARIESSPDLKLSGPIGYLDMLSVNCKAKVILTDSGGLQEEAIVLGVPCITLRETTERPATVSSGGNQIVGSNPSRIRSAVHAVLDRDGFEIRRPELWDGRASVRIADVLRNRRLQRLEAENHC